MPQPQLTASYIARNGHAVPKVHEDAKLLVRGDQSHVVFVDVGKKCSLWYDHKTRDNIVIEN